MANQKERVFSDSIRQRVHGIHMWQQHKSNGTALQRHATQECDATQSYAVQTNCIERTQIDMTIENKRLIA